MWTILTACFLNIFHLGSTLSILGHSTSGTEFLFGCYGLSGDKTFSGKLTLSTNFYQVVYKVWVPKELNTGEYTADKTRAYTLGAWKARNIKIMNACKVIRPGIYKSYRIEASLPIMVILRMHNVNFRTHREAFKVIPWRTCFTKYHITANKGHTFMAVHAFNLTELTVRLANKSSYDVPCWTNSSQRCSPGKVVKVTMKPHQFWYFVLDDSDADLQGTTLESDNPVFVVAGNLEEQLSQTARDITASSMKPTVAWGKIYIIPHFFVSDDYELTVFIRIVAEKFPFQFKVLKGSPVNMKEETITSTDGQNIEQKTKHGFAVFSNISFGLHAMVPMARYSGNTIQDYSMVNIIPVEQWINGIFRVVDWEEIISDRSRFSYYILSTLDPKNVFFKRVSAGEWKKVFTINNINFYLTKFSTPGITFDVYVKNTTTRIMIYIKYEHPGSTGTAFPFDYYQGAIFHRGCTKVIPVLSDGVDNDCDGFIDEEILNGEDDDGDGAVDEDLVEAYRSGEWSAWVPSCSINCDDDETPCGRECVNTSRFGVYCQGNVTTKCKKILQNESFPNKCGEVDLQRNCECTPNCSDCTQNGFACKNCSSGYLTSTYCLFKCPLGWKGSHCTRGPRSLSDFYDLQDQPKTIGESPIPFWLTLILSFLIGAITLICLVLMLMACRSKEQKSTLPATGQEPEVDQVGHSSEEKEELEDKPTKSSSDSSSEDSSSNESVEQDEPEEMDDDDDSA